MGWRWLTGGVSAVLSWLSTRLPTSTSLVVNDANLLIRSIHLNNRLTLLCRPLLACPTRHRRRRARPPARHAPPPTSPPISPHRIHPPQLATGLTPPLPPHLMGFAYPDFHRPHFFSTSYPRHSLASPTHSSGTRPDRSASSPSASPSTAAPTAASSSSTSTRPSRSRPLTRGATSSSFKPRRATLRTFPSSSSATRLTSRRASAWSRRSAR